VSEEWDNPRAWEKVEFEARASAVDIKRALIESEWRQPVRCRRIRVAGHRVEVCDIPVIEAKVVDLGLANIHVRRLVWVASPSGSAKHKFIVPLSAFERDVEAEKFRSFTQIDDAAILLVAPLDVRKPPVADIGISADPRFGGRSRRGFRLSRR